MEQCKEKFAFVELFMTGNSAPMVQRGMLCGRNRTYTKRVENPGPTHCFLCRKELDAVGEVSMAESVVGDLLCGTRQRHGKKNGGHGEQEMSETQQRLRKGERTVSTEWWRERHRQETRSWKGSTWTRTNKDFFVHRWAGYIERSGKDTQTAMALRTGGLQWWREAQRKHSSKWNDVHPRRFSCWRWKAQIAEFKEYNDGMSADVTGRSTGQKTMEEKKEHSIPRGLGEKTR